MPSLHRIERMASSSLGVSNQITRANPNGFIVAKFYSRITEEINSTHAVAQFTAFSGPRELGPDSYTGRKKYNEGPSTCHRDAASAPTLSFPSSPFLSPFSPGRCGWRQLRRRSGEEMLKAFMPVAVYSLIVSFHTDSFRRASMLNMLGISAGVAVAVAAYGEARFDAFGVMLQLAAVAAEATWLVLIQILVTSKGKSLNPHYLALLYRAVLPRVLDAAMAKAAPPWLAANDVVTAVTAAGRRLPTPSSLVGLLPTLTSLRKEVRERRKGEKKGKSKGCDMETLTCRLIWFYA
uniref:Sugar phosphate transporter domain-containing protein n=1 Tax=Oryza glaberrima TaxID=4538 RepID=I1PAI4_ORYGL